MVTEGFQISLPHNKGKHKHKTFGSREKSPTVYGKFRKTQTFDGRGTILVRWLMREPLYRTI